MDTDKNLDLRQLWSFIRVHLCLSVVEVFLPHISAVKIKEANPLYSSARGVHFPARDGH